MNVQRTVIRKGENKLEKKLKSKNKTNIKILKKINDLANKSKKPLLLLGNGANDKKNFSLINKLVKKYNFQVVTSLLGIGSYDTRKTNHHGYIGHTGHIAANFAAYTCDFLLVL